MGLALAASEASAQRADALVLVNSLSPRAADFQQKVKPYLDHFGVPYTVLDIATANVGPEVSSYALVIVGHASLDTTLSRLDATEQANLSAAVRDGTGFVNFDNDLATGGGVARYAFVQEIFGFGYGAERSGNWLVLAADAPAHYVTSRHAGGETLSAPGLAMPTLTVPAGATVLASNLDTGAPFLVSTAFGQGRAVQWASYDWMSSFVRGPVYGLDDLVWRGMVWAARKPFAMRGLPNFLTMRVDDVEGGLWWVPIANEFQIKPWLGLFYERLSAPDTLQLRSLVDAGLATASVHARSNSDFFYFDHFAGRNLPDATVAANFQAATAWHAANGIPVSSYVVPHYYEIGSNVFAGLRSWGVEFVATHMAPGSPYFGAGTPWLNLGPYRLYETDSADTVVPVAYADYLTVPGHPEFANSFFNCVTEIRDDAGYEWFPDSNVAVSIGRGTRQVKRAFDSMVLASLFTHEYYLQDISESAWRSTLSGIVSNLASYDPVYVTTDYACRYVRAKHGSRFTSATFDAPTQTLTADFSGAADIPTVFMVFTETAGTIVQATPTLPAFTGTARVNQQLGGPLHHVVVTPSTGLVAAGGTLRFTAQGYDSAGNPISGLAFHWSAAAGGTIDQTGRFTAGTSPGTFTSAVSASAGGVTGYATVEVYAQVLDRFGFAPMAGPVYAGVPFGVQVTALDQAGNALPAYAGPAQLRDATGSLSPTSTGVFSGGVWSGSATIAQASAGNALIASDGAVTGTSGSFDVLPPPANTSLWPATAAPANPDHGPDSAVELGVKFRSDVPGFVTGVRFYKASTNTGTHRGSLWSGAGALLATATFGSETPSGWQEVSFATPVPIAAGAEYVASYHTSVGHYAQDLNYFASAGVDRPPLHAPSSPASAGNGVYAYGASTTFPSSSYLATNYWVDIVFSATPPQPPATVVVTPASAVLPTGGTQQFTAQAFDAANNPLSGLVFTWSTAGGGAVTQGGLFTAGSAPGTYTNNVVASTGGVSGAASTEIVARTLSRFAFAPVAGPVFAGTPVPVQITALDQFGAALPTYAGPAQLSDTTGTVSPSVTGAFIAGTWSGSVTLTAPAPSVTLTASDGAASGASDAFTVRAPGPDLVETAVSSPPATVAAGGTFTVTDTVANQGNAAAAASTTRHYLSLDALPDASDVLLSGSRAVGALGAGASSSGTVTVTVPVATPGGTYRLLSCADGAGTVAEADEANNCRAAAAQVQVAGRPDLVESSVSAPPAVAPPGSGFSVTDTATNQGTGTAAASTTRYYLSLDALRNTGDVLVTGTRAVASLAAGASSTGTVTVTVPSSTALGTYYLLACADDAAVVAEVSDANNCIASATAVQVARPDLVETAVSNPPAGARAGTAFSVTDTAANQGAAPAAATTTRYYLSVDAIRNTGDVRLTGTRAAGALAAGATSTGTVSVTIPTSMALGTYYLLACADDTAAVAEGDETNNCLASATQIELARPDLAETAVSSPPASARAGTGFSVTDTAANLSGLASAAASTTRFYLSLDAVQDAADVRMTGTRSVAALAAGATSTGTVTVTVPAATVIGTYYLLACADDTGAVAETDEANNCLAAAAQLVVTKPDLVVAALSNPPATAAAGAGFSVTDSVRNQGTAAAGTTSTVRYYLSLDATQGTGDVLLSRTRSVAALAVGATSTATGTVTVPAGMPAGAYYLIACADDTARVPEIDETNNCLASTTVVVTTP